MRRWRFRALRWSLGKTQTGRAVLWNEWLNGREFGVNYGLSDSGRGVAAVVKEKLDAVS